MENAIVRTFILFFRISAINEIGNCADPNRNNCHQNAECIDIHPGRHFCACKIGFIGDGLRCDGNIFILIFIILDVDECSIPGLCDNHALCKNLNGTFECRCSDSYKGDGFKCTKVFLTNLTTTTSSTRLILSCRENPHICHPNAQCLSLFNRCECYYGFEGDGIHQCRRSNHIKPPPYLNSVLSTTQKSTISTYNLLEQTGLTTVKKTLDYVENKLLTTIQISTTKNVPNEMNPVYGKRCGVAICHPFATCDMQQNVCKCNHGFDGDGYYSCE